MSIVNAISCLDTTVETLREQRVGRTADMPGRIAHTVTHVAQTFPTLSLTPQTDDLLCLGQFDARSRHDIVAQEPTEVEELQRRDEAVKKVKRMQLEAKKHKRFRDILADLVHLRWRNANSIAETRAETENIILPSQVTKAPASESNRGTMTAVERVFGMVELLDAILLHNIPHSIDNTSQYTDAVRQTLIFQLVNKTFYQHIHGDTTISRILHVHPAFANTLPWYIYGRRSPHRTVDMSYDYLQVMLNPSSWYDGVNEDITFRLYDTAFNAKVGSWSKLLLCQPPTSKVCMHRTTYYGSQSAKNRLVISNENGLTVGDIWRAAKNLRLTTENVAAGHTLCCLNLDKDGNERD